MTFSDYYIFTDGSCLGNPGPGGWAFLVVKKVGSNKGKKIKLRSGKLDVTTNNLAEMKAMKEALLYIKQRCKSTTVTIYTDSKYVMNCLLRVWQPKIHLDKWRKLYSLIENTIHVKWIKAHTTNKGFRAMCNSIVDERAKNEAKEVLDTF